MHEYCFRCEECKTRFAIKLNHFYSNDDKPKYCPVCDSTKITKLISKSNFLIKDKD